MIRIQWNSLSFFLLSLLSTGFIYWLTSSVSDSHSERLSSQILLAEASDSVQQGSSILLNGRKFAIAWSQWEQGNSRRTGISDTGAMNLLGLELLSNTQPDLQPVRWFGTDSGQPLPVLARFIAPYRYLDVTELIQMAAGQLQTRGDTLEINLPPAQIGNIRQGNEAWGKRIIIDVDRPTVWQVSQAQGQGVVMISGNTTTTSPPQFTPIPSEPRGNADEDDLGSGSFSPGDSQLFSLENTANLTKVSVNLPTAYGLQVSSLVNPPRIVIDVRADAITPKEIVWTPGIIWRQQLVKVQRGVKESIFPVNWLEIDGRSPKIALKPITTNPNNQQGTAPVVTTAQAWQAAAAINGGFFNRNNQLPLGAIRQDHRWLSSPILGRGAIAWNNQGQIKVDRLSLRETLITATGQRLPILLLNSGYIQAGMARYTPEWGAAYTPLTDNETLIFVQNNQIIEQKTTGKAGSENFPIPSGGYLLTIRKNAVSSSGLAVGMGVNLESATVPAEFNQYPYILGAGPLLIRDRRIVLDAAAENFSKGFQQQQASRSAIGTTDQGKIMLVAVHNRIGGRGASLDEMAQIMQQLGAIDALNLDGGSSTSLALGGQLLDRSPVTAARVHNGIGVFINP